MLLPKGVDELPEPLTDTDLTPIRLLGEHVADVNRAIQAAVEHYQQAIKPVTDALTALRPLIHFPVPTIRLPPQIAYLVGASRGDRGAARWLAENMHWEPDASTTKLLTLHARIKRQPPEQIWIETLADAFLNILQNRETPLVFHIRGAGPMITPEGGPFTAKVGGLSIPFLYKWVQAEAVRHAPNILMGVPYSLQVILERQPVEGEEDTDLVAWPETTSSLILPTADLGGRPPGSTAFPMESFPEEYRAAYQRLLEQDRDKLPTLVEVAAELLIDRRTLFNYRNRLHLPWPPG